MMSLGAIDFGLLVDGAIVMLEGTLHALDKQRPPPDEVPAAVAKAMARAAKPVAFAVGIIMLVYLPLMALEGVASVFMVEDFVTVTKRPEADWQELIPRVEAAIRANL